LWPDFPAPSAFQGGVPSTSGHLTPDYKAKVPAMSSHKSPPGYYLDPNQLTSLQGQWHYQSIHPDIIATTIHSGRYQYRVQPVI